jgi:predicted DNA-binding transcriptional regulator YafY
VTPRLSALLDALKSASRAGTRATAHRLAEDLGVSVRTLYRDLDRLRAAGVAIAGKTGVGLSVERTAKLPEVAHRGEPQLEARVRVTADGAKQLGADPQLTVDRGRGPERVVRASRDALVRAALRAGGAVVVITPEKLRREVRNKARDIARAHKG